MKPAIETSKGTFFDFSDIENQYIDIDIVAKSLSKQTRYNGHGVREFYSVAEHCVLASYLVDDEHAYDALMHDSAEAITGDIVSPLKNMLPEFKEIEKKVEKRCANVFGNNYPYPKQVKIADKALWAIEKEWLFPNSKKEWGAMPENPFEGLDFDKVSRVKNINHHFGDNRFLFERFMSPDRIESIFIRRFEELLSLHV